METENTIEATPRKRITLKQQREIEKSEAIRELREMIKPGSEVCCILRHCSKSGMSRDISLVLSLPLGFTNITHLAALAMGEKKIESYGHFAIRVGGCGMDMGFALVYNLGRTLFPEGFKPRDAGKNYGRNGSSADDIDPDGGYALKAVWI